MARQLRAATDEQVDELARIYGNMSMLRDQTRDIGARKAALAISRAMKSLDGAIRHARRCADRAAECQA